MQLQVQDVLTKDLRLKSEAAADNHLLELYQRNGVPRDQVLKNLGLFLDRITWTDYLFFLELYKLQLNVHGVIAEFGVRWGKNLSFLIAMRSILEPYNYTRKVLGFDTFQGLPELHQRDKRSEGVHAGSFSVVDGYEVILDDLLSTHEAKSPIPQLKKFELVKGDVRETLDEYLECNPETIFSFVYFDMDLYEPTKYCLSRIRSHLTKGSVVGFDELCHPKFPGETVALMEEVGLGSVGLRRFPFASRQSYFCVS